MSLMTLYVDSRYFSPYAMSAYVALCELGLGFELKPLDLEAGAQHRSPFRERSGTGRIPTLRHGDFWLSESSAICEYLHDAFPGSKTPLYPAATSDLARARQVQAWLRSDLGALRQERPTDVVYCGERRGPLTAEAQRAADKLVAFAGALVGESAGVFAEWSIVDTELALALNRLVLHGDPVPESLARFARAQWSRPAVQAWCALAHGLQVPQNVR
jgi:glutathione S-transferase